MMVNEAWLRDFASLQPEVFERAMDHLVELGDDDVVSELIELLYSRSPLLRNRAAGALWRIGNPRAVPALIEAFEQHRESGDTGSLIYAMRVFDCSAHFDWLCALVFDDVFEIRAMALMVLDRQSFQASAKEVERIRLLIASYRRIGPRRPEDLDAMRYLEDVLARVKIQPL